MIQLKQTQKYEEIIKSQRINKLLEHAEEDWGDPMENREKIVRTGIPALDNIFIGFGPELIGIMGQSGSRKSTFIANVVLFNALSNSIDKRTPQVIFAAESGMPPNRYRDVLLAMRATQWLKLFKRKGKLPNTTSEYLFADFFRYYEPNEVQKKAMEYAIRDLSEAPIYILGAGEKGGIDTLENFNDTFAALNDNLGYAAYYIDHIQSIYVPGVYDDYGIMQAITPVLDRNVKLYESPIVAVSQVSLTSRRNNNPEARGGAKLRELSSIYLKINYDKMPRHRIKLKIEKSRKSVDTIEVGVDIEPNSGLVIGDGEIVDNEAALNSSPHMENIFDDNLDLGFD